MSFDYSNLVIFQTKVTMASFLRPFSDLSLLFFNKCVLLTVLLGQILRKRGRCYSQPEVDANKKNKEIIGQMSSSQNVIE
jgi:hypothetical protein